MEHSQPCSWVYLCTVCLCAHVYVFVCVICACVCVAVSLRVYLVCVCGVYVSLCGMSVPVLFCACGMNMCHCLTAQVYGHHRGNMVLKAYNNLSLGPCSQSVGKRFPVQLSLAPLGPQSRNWWYLKSQAPTGQSEMHTQACPSTAQGSLLHIP